MTGVPAPGDPGVRLLAVHAHPDDETLATGLALAHHRAQGDEVHVVTATRGEEGEVIPAELAYLEGTEELAVHRAGELEAAMAVLGVQQHWLGGDRVSPFRDSGMAGSAAAARPDAFCAADVEVAAGLLRDQVVALAPDLVLTYDPQGGYGHPDHIQTHRVCVAALAGLAGAERPPLYVVLVPRSWAEEDRDWVARHVAAGTGAVLPGPGDPYPPSVVPDGAVTHRLSAAPEVVAARDAALREHRTQVRVHEGWYTLSNDVAARLVRREGYARWVHDD